MCGAWLVIGRWQLELRAFVDFAGIEADAYVLRVRGDAMFRVHVGEDEFVELGLRDGTLVVDRSEGREISEGFSGRFTRDAPNAEGFVAVVDRFSIELFGDGEVITASAFQGSDSRGIELVAGTPAHVTLRRLRREPRAKGGRSVDEEKQLLDIGHRVGAL